MKFYYSINIICFTIWYIFYNNFFNKVFFLERSATWKNFYNDCTDASKPFAIRCHRTTNVDKVLVHWPYFEYTESMKHDYSSKKILVCLTMLLFTCIVDFEERRELVMVCLRKNIEYIKGIILMDKEYINRLRTLFREQKI